MKNFEDVTTQTNPELDKHCLSVPAANANNITCHVMQNGLRITFLEGVPNVQPGVVRGAVIIPWEVAHGLQEMIKAAIALGGKAGN